jgi:hypothetical protein
MMKKKERQHACRQKQTLKAAVVEEVLVVVDQVVPADQAVPVNAV